MNFLKLDDLICDNLNIIPFKTFKFSGGEQHIAIDQTCINNADENMKLDVSDAEITIEVRLNSCDKIMLLLIATDALKRGGYKKINLFSPYIPYARQDRVCNPGEALSIKVMCDLINSQGYQKVWTLDNHSEVSTALLNNVSEISLYKIIMNMTSENSIEKGDDFTRYALVSPDAGALKKTWKLSKQMGGIPVIECSKKRDVRNGDIIGVEINEVKNKLKIFERLLIVDDICDGGRTFIELAKEIKKYTDVPIELFVSHGIFSKGFDVFKGLIDKVYSTNSFDDASGGCFRYEFKMSDLW